MRVLVTRAEPDASSFAELCRAHGLTPILAPLMNIDIYEQPVDLADVSALAFTSANGVRAFAANEGSRRLPIFAVGEVTAKAARDAGFYNIRPAGGDVESLTDCIASERELSPGALLHLAGEDRAGDLVTMLAARGIKARRQTLYKAQAINVLPVGVSALLKADPPEWASFFSPRTAKLFLALAKDAGVADRLKYISAACLSDAVAAAAGDGWRAKCVAHERTAASLVKMITVDGAPRA